MKCNRTLQFGKYLFNLERNPTCFCTINIFKNYNFTQRSFLSNLSLSKFSYRVFTNSITQRRFIPFVKPLNKLINSDFARFSSNPQPSSNLHDVNDENSTPLTKSQADDLILRLTEDERKALLTALQEYNSNQIKAEYEGQLAATRWRSKFGRPSKLPTLGDVDPTGSFCHLPEDWLKKKYAEKVPAPNGHQLLRVCIFNAVPFVGFGFLDNFIMIVAGDYIDETLGSLVTISTMAAAALGNTISDVMGIGSAWYVELAASKVGLRPPNLSPIQLDMKSARRAANLGRALGIVVGCLLGMLPLLFINKEDVKKKEKP